jgi:hypothetical protein
MKGSRFMGRQVLLTCAALFLLAFSMGMFWYHVSFIWVEGSQTLTGENRYAANYYTVWSTGPTAFHYADKTYTYSQNFSPMGDILSDVQTLAMIWFLIALLYLGSCLLDERRWSIVTGWILVAASLAPMLYFVARAANGVSTAFAIQDLHVAGFMGTSRNDIGSSETTGPMGGFWLATVASALQITAVVMRSYVVFSTKKNRNPDAKPAMLEVPQEPPPEMQ